MDQQRDRPDPPDQTYGQGEGEHDATIPEEDDEASTTTYTEGTATELGEPESLAREDEGMDR